MKEITVDVADMVLSKDPDEALVAPSLGSCIAVSIYDSQLKAGGVMICMLPKASEMAQSQLKQHTFMFADTGIPAFIKAAREFGLADERIKLVVAGGGKILGQHGPCDIGSRNLEVAREMLSRLGLDAVHQSVGGSFNRTLDLQISSGVSTITTVGDGVETI